jgi:hypothetical protein
VKAYCRHREYVLRVRIEQHSIRNCRKKIRHEGDNCRNANRVSRRRTPAAVRISDWGEVRNVEDGTHKDADSRCTSPGERNIDRLCQSHSGFSIKWSKVGIRSTITMSLQPSLRSLAVIGHPNAAHTMDVFREPSKGQNSLKRC